MGEREDSVCDDLMWSYCRRDEDSLRGEGGFQMQKKARVIEVLDVSFERKKNSIVIALRVCFLGVRT